MKIGRHKYTHNNDHPHTDVLLRHVLQSRNEMADVIAVRIGLFAKRDRRIHAKICVEKGRSREPVPVTVIQRPIRI